MRVAVRVRPLLSFEKTERLGECLSCIPQSKQLCVGDGGDNGRNTFTFDFTFPKACEQRALYDDCVASLLEGGMGRGTLSKEVRKSAARGLLAVGYFHLLDDALSVSFPRHVLLYKNISRYAQQLTLKAVSVSFPSPLGVGYRLAGM